MNRDDVMRNYNIRIKSDLVVYEMYIALRWSAGV